MCRAAFAILEMFVLLHALSPPEKVNIQHSIFHANVVQILNITSCHLNRISDIRQASRIRVSQSVNEWARPCNGRTRFHKCSNHFVINLGRILKVVLLFESQMHPQSS